METLCRGLPLVHIVTGIKKANKLLLKLIVMNIEDLIKQDGLVSEIKEKPFVSTFILVAAVALAYLSVTFPENENVGFAMMLLSVGIAIMGLKGVIWPKKHFEYKPTREKIAREEYYFDSQQVVAVQKCIAVDNPVHRMEMLESLPQNGGTGLRVIVYTTKSGSYMKSQMQKYIPYEYIPM